jgi:hypothetical protein
MTQHTDRVLPASRVHGSQLGSAKGLWVSLLLRHSLSRFSASLSRSLSHSQSLSVCARAKGRTKKEGKEKEEGEGSGDAGDKGENEGKITEMPLTLNLTTFYPLP